MKGSSVTDKFGNKHGGFSGSVLFQGGWERTISTLDCRAPAPRTQGGPVSCRIEEEKPKPM